VEVLVLVLLDEVLVLVLEGLLVLEGVEVLVELPDPVVVLVLVPVLGDEG